MRSLPLLIPMATWAFASPAVAILHVNVVDVRSAAIHIDQTVVIRGDRIESAGRTAPAKDARHINGRGKYLIPGLWDMHVHTGGSNDGWFPLFLANGVTGLRVTETSLRTFAELREYREAISSGRREGPMLVATAESIEGAGPSKPPPFGVRTESDAREAIARLLAARVDFIKIGESIPPAAYFAVAQECNRLSLPFAGHVPLQLTPSAVSEAGQRSIEHLDGLLLACSSAESSLRSQIQRGLPVDIETVISTFDRKKAAELAALLRRNRTWVCPTLTTSRFAAESDGNHWDRDPRLRYVPARYLQGWASRRRTVEHAKYAKELFRLDLELTGLLWHGGVRILAGTDTPWPYCVPGFALHDELELLVRAGLPPAAALAAATVGPAEFLNTGLPGGAIESGAPANLLLLEKNPLTSIAGTRTIAGAVLHGKWLDRRNLHQMLDRAASAAAGR